MPPCAAIINISALTGKVGREKEGIRNNVALRSNRGDAEGCAKLTADNLVVLNAEGAYGTKASILEQIRRDGQTATANFRAAVRGSSCGVAPKTPTALDLKIDALKG